jgi:hypothetical protein
MIGRRAPAGPKNALRSSRARTIARPVRPTLPESPPVQSPREILRSSMGLRVVLELGLDWDGFVKGIVAGEHRRPALEGR